MACCGDRRRQIAQTPTAPKNEPHPASPRPRFSVVFEYTGRTALTAVGPVSGRPYRFERPGARLGVDPRDRPGLASVPKLRQVE